MKPVNSDIPQGVLEKPVPTDQAGLGQGHRVVDCYISDHLVGRRIYNSEGILVLETPMNGRRKHGREMTWDDAGNLLSMEPYVNGLMHGTAKQYGRNGKVIGTYKMKYGTGFDIWRQEDQEGEVFVSEIHSLKEGVPHGYEWWFASLEQVLVQERHWHLGKCHGIERVWNSRGRLRRGYPRFFIADQAVSKQEYVKAALLDKTLPVFRERDNLPGRKLPSEIKKLLGA